MATMIPLFAFVFGTALVGGLAYVLMPSSANAIDRRLDELTFVGLSNFPCQVCGGKARWWSSASLTLHVCDSCGAAELDEFVAASAYPMDGF